MGGNMRVLASTVMRASLVLLVVAGAGLLFEAGTFLWASADDGIRPVPDPGRPLALRLEVDRGTGATYFPGERISFRLFASEACYLTLYDVQAHGRAHVIFPHRWEESALLPGGRWRSIPDAADRWHYEVTGGPGIEVIVALATRGPVTPRWLDGAEVPPVPAGASREEAIEHLKRQAEGLNARIVPVPDDILAVAATWIVVGSVAPRAPDPVR